MSIIIKKAKLKDSKVEIEYSRIDSERNITEVTEKPPYIAHSDMINAFHKLKKHLACLCDLREGDSITRENADDDSEALLSLYVTQFTVSGSDDDEGVVITGGKTLPSGKTINLNTPFTKYTDEYDPYELSEELWNDIQACIFEVEAYMDGKYAVKQAEIDFGENDKVITESLAKAV